MKQNITIAIILALTVLGYGSMNIVMEQQKMNAEKTKQFQNDMLRTNCLNDAIETYQYSWNNDPLCNFKDGVCLLPGYRAEIRNKWLVDEKDRCVQMYK